MVKSGIRSTPDAPYRGVSRNSYYEFLQGTYGRKKNNPVLHCRELLTRPGWIKYGEDTDAMQRTYSNSANGWGNVIHSELFDQIGAVEYRALNVLFKKVDPRDLKFNIFNFLLEMREIPKSIKDPLSIAVKRLNKPKKRVIGQSFFKPSQSSLSWARGVGNDVSSTYLNGQFGWTPTVGELRYLADEVGDAREAYLRVKALSEQTFSTRYEVPLKTMDLEMSHSEFLGTVFKVRVSGKVSVQARWSYDVPMLDSFAFLSSRADQLGLRFDLATVWNAIPFSWLIDYIIPIGDALAADSTNWTEIRPILKGSVSTKLFYEVILDEKSSRFPALVNGYPITADSMPSTVKGTFYKRDPISDVRAYRYPPPDFFKGWDGRKTGIAAALGAPISYSPSTYSRLRI